MDSAEVIYCIGDSHASFFSGYDEIQPVYPLSSRNRLPFFKSYRLGAVLAYSLNKSNTKERGREKLLDLVASLKQPSHLLLCFGEIDCRCHLLKQAEKQSQSLDQIIKNCVDNYFEAIDELRQMNFKVSLWGAIASAESANKEYPTYGTMTERNVCTIKFNQHLKTQCLKRNMKFISVTDYLIDKNYNTKIRYYFDSIHLGQSAMPFALMEFKKNKIETIPHRYTPFRIRLMILRSYIHIVIMVFYNWIKKYLINNIKQF